MGRNLWKNIISFPDAERERATSTYFLSCFPAHGNGITLLPSVVDRPSTRSAEVREQEVQKRGIGARELALKLNHAFSRINKRNQRKLTRCFVSVPFELF